MPNKNVKQRLLVLALYTLHLTGKALSSLTAKFLSKSVDLQTTNATLGFSVELVDELASEDVDEFQVMFLISTDSFDGPSRRFLRHIARLDGPSIERKHCMTMLFQVKFALRRSPRHTTRLDGRLDGRQDGVQNC